MNQDRIDRLWQYHEMDPGNVNLLRDIAREGMGSGAYAQTIKALDKLAALEVADANDEAAAVHALIKMGQIDQACERGLQARASWPEDGGLRVEIARALLNARRFKDAVQQTEGGYEDPALAQMAGELRLQALWHLGEVAPASDLAAELVVQFPQNPRLAAQYSALLYDQDRGREAFDEARRAYALSPQHAYTAIHVLASERLLHRDPAGALKLVEEAQRTRQDDGRVWLLKGSAQLLAGKVDDAIADIKRALDIFPDHPGSHLLLAWVYITRNELDQAEDMVHRAIEASPAFGESHGTLAVVYALKGQREEARQSIRRASLLAKGGFAARYAQALLDGGADASAVANILKDLAQNIKV